LNHLRRADGFLVYGGILQAGFLYLVKRRKNEPKDISGKFGESFIWQNK